MDLNSWLAFLLASWLIAISPGSGAVLSMSHGLAYGVRQTTMTILGLQLGLAVVLLIAGVGVGAILIASVTAFTVVKVLGAAYLFYLGVKQWRSSVDIPLRQAGPNLTRQLDGPSRLKCVLMGFVTNVTNPKGIVFMVAVLPQFIDPERSLGLQLLILLVTMVCTDLIVMHGYAYMASRAQRWLATAKARRIQNRVFGGVLMAMGTSLLLVRRSA